MNFPAWSEIEEDPKFQSLDVGQKKKYFDDWNKLASEHVMSRGLYRDNEFSSAFLNWRNQKASEYGDTKPYDTMESLYESYQEPEGGYGIGAQLMDIPIGLARGAAQGIRGFTDILGADNPISQEIRGSEDWLGSLMSAQARDDQEEIARIFQEAEDEGVLGQVQAGIKAFSVAPVDTVVQALGTMAPMVIGGLAANALKLGAIGVKSTIAAMSAAQNTGIVKATIYDEVRQELIANGVPEDIAHEKAVEAQRYDGKNLDQILLGTGIGAASGLTGAEKIMGNILTKTGVEATRGRILSGLKSGVTEGATEAIQAGQGTFAGGQALRREGFDVPLRRGVFTAATMEGIAGMGVGTLAGTLQRREVAQDAADNADKSNAPSTADALREAAKKAERARVEEEAKAEEERFAPPPTTEFREEDFIRELSGRTPEELDEAQKSYEEMLDSEVEEERDIAKKGIAAIRMLRGGARDIGVMGDIEGAVDREIGTAPEVAEEADVFEGVRRGPLIRTARESALEIERELSALDTLRKSPVGADALRRLLQGEELAGNVRRAVAGELATAAQVDEEADVFAGIPRPRRTARESAEAIESQLNLLDSLKKSPQGRDALLGMLRGEEIAGNIRQAIEEEIAMQAPVGEGDAFAGIRRREDAVQEQIPAEGAIRQEPQAREGVREEDQVIQEPTREGAQEEVVAGLRAVSENTATPEQIASLSQAGLVDVIKGQPVVNEDGEAILAQAQAPLPALTPKERVAEIEGVPTAQDTAPVTEQAAPAVAPAPEVAPVEQPKIIAYRGDKDGIQEFQMNEGEGMESDFGKGPYFTSSERIATSYAAGADEAFAGIKVPKGKKVYKAEVDIKKPLWVWYGGVTQYEKMPQFFASKEFQALAEKVRATGDKSAIFNLERAIKENGFRNYNGATFALASPFGGWEKAKSVFKEVGFDGIAAQLGSDGDPSTQYIPFSQNQINIVKEPTPAVSETITEPSVVSEEGALVSEVTPEPTIREEPQVSPMIGAEPTQPAPAEGVTPAPETAAEAAPAAPSGIAAGNRVRVGRSPQTYVVEEVLESTPQEAELGEQYFTIRNERTGELQTVEQKDIKPVREKREAAAAEEVQPVPAEEQYTLKQVQSALKKLFGRKIPDRIKIINDPENKNKAGYYVDNGEIELNLAYLEKTDNLESIIIHEIGHFLYSDPEFQAAFQSFWESIPDDKKENITNYVKSAYSKKTGEVQIEEAQVIAFEKIIARSKRGVNWWTKLKDIINRTINRIFGTNFEVSDQGAMAVLAAGIKRYGSGERIIRETKKLPKGSDIRRMAAEPRETVMEEGGPRKKTNTQKLVEMFTEVTKQPVKITVNERTALKDQIRLKAREAREGIKARKQASQEILDTIKGLVIRGKVRPSQLRSLTKRAIKLIPTNEKSVEGFLDYFDRVVENANYDKDVENSKNAQKEAARFLKQKKKVPANKLEILEKIGKINPAYLDNPGLFAATVNEYLLALKSPTSKNYRVVPDDVINGYLNEASEASNKESEKRKKALLESKLRRALDNDNATEEELRAFQESGQYDAHVAKLEDNKKQAVLAALKRSAEETKESLGKYDYSEMNPQQQSIIDRLRRANIEALSPNELRSYILFGDNIIANDVTYGAESAAIVIEAKERLNDFLKNNENARRGRLAFKTLENLQEGTSAEVLGQSDAFRNIFGKGKILGVIQRALGIKELNEAQVEVNETIKDIEQEFDIFYKDLSKKYPKANDEDNLLAEGVVSYIIQKQPELTEEQSIAERIGTVEALIANWKRTEDQAEFGKKVETALNAVRGTTIQQILDNLKAKSEGNYKSLMWIKNTLLPTYREKIKSFDENFQNQIGDYSDPNYIPIAWKRRVISPESIEDSIDDFRREGISIPQPASTIARKRVVGIPKDQNGRDMDLDFNVRKDTFNSLVETVSKAYTAPAWLRIKSFLSDPRAVEVFGTEENLNNMTRMLGGLYFARNRRAYSMTGINKLADTLTTGLRRLGSGYALGGVSQAITQPADQILNTIINVGDPTIVGLSLMPGQQLAAIPFLQRFPIGQRADVLAGTNFLNASDAAYQRVERYLKSGNYKAAKAELMKFNDTWLIVLKKSDVFSARSAWMSYYMQGLKQAGITFKDWETENSLYDSDPQRQEIALRAEALTDINQGSSDPTKMALFAQRGRSGSENVLKAMLLPFNSFAVQQKARMASDFRDLITGTTSLKEKVDAAKGLTATIAGLLAFNYAATYIRAAMYAGGASMLLYAMGVEEEEMDEEEKKELAKFKFRKFMGRTVGNIIGGGGGQLAEGLAIDSFNYAAYMIYSANDMEEVKKKNGELMTFSTFKRTNAPLWRYESIGGGMDLGIFTIPTEQISKTAAAYKELATPEFMDKFTDEERRIIYLNSLIQTAYLTRMSDTDVYRTVGRAKQIVEETAEERERKRRAAIRKLAR